MTAEEPSRSAQTGFLQQRLLDEAGQHKTQAKDREAQTDGSMLILLVIAAVGGIIFLASVVLLAFMLCKLRCDSDQTRQPSPKPVSFGAMKYTDSTNRFGQTE